MIHAPPVQITGPLSRHVQGLWRSLLAQGYTPLSSRNLLRVMAHVSRWLEEKGLRVDELTDKVVETFFEARRRARYTQFLTPRALQPIRSYLEAAGIRFPVAAKIRTPIDRLLGEYASYLLHERAVTAGVARAYDVAARRFFFVRFGDQSIRLNELQAQDVTAFVLSESRQYSVGTVKYTVSALRSLLRYLYVRGSIARDLTGAVPAVAGWRLSGLPKGLEPQEVERLLAARDRRSHTGRRDHAVVLVMVRLGLRAGEVARLRLDDIDWAHGEFVVRGKGRREARLPLPADVGTALAGYIRRSRPRTSCRSVFLRVRAPQGAISPDGIKAITRACARSAGLRAASSHRLRHTAATQMLRRGGSLDEIAQVLRHKSHDTTAIYAKVDISALRAVTRPWPGGAR